MKGRGFSRAAGADEGIAASAAEGMFGAEQTFPEAKEVAGKGLVSAEIHPNASPQGLKPTDSVAFRYGLKPVPFTLKPCPFNK